MRQALSLTPHRPYDCRIDPLPGASLLTSSLQTNRFLFVYDILVFSETREDHVKQVRLVLRNLLENKLFVKAEKCEFKPSSIPFSVL